MLLILYSLFILSGVILTKRPPTMVRPLAAHRRFGRALQLGRLLGSVLLGAVFFFHSAPLLSQTPPMVETSAEADSETDKAIVEQILTCLEKGQEAVLRQRQPVECAPFGKGVSRVEASDVNIASVCDDPRDLRRLSGNAIKLIAKQKDRIDPIGIRVIGGVYCKSLDLIGLDLPYSLVLDKSVFKDGVQGRSFRTRGDLSFDKSLMLGQLFLARIRVDGTIFANEAVIQKMRLLDAEVHGSVLLRNSVILDLAAFDTVLLSGELSVRNSLFPYLLVQFSKVGGVLDLTDSRARCAYKIRKSEIGDIVAVNSGFGTVGPPPQQVPDARLQYEWEPPRAGSDAAVRLKAAADNMPVDQSASGKICDHSSISYSPGSILISDTKIKSSLCLRSFHWLKGAQAPVSYVTVQQVSVGTAASIDLAEPNVNPKSVTDKSHKLEIIDFETGSLFLNFNDPRNPQPNAMYISGLKFEHVYAAEVACLYEPNFSDSDTKKADDAKAAAALSVTSNPGSDRGAAKAATERIRIRSLGNDADPAGNSRLPKVEEVMGWLNGNLLATTQPFQAFVDVFQKHGEEDDARALRVAKADAQLCLKARRVFGKGICGRQSEAETGISPTTVSSGTSAATNGSETSDTTSAATKKVDKASWWNEIFSALLRWIELGADFVLVMLGGVLWLIAGNGYHPEKVGYFVVLSIIVFAIYFWFVLRAVGLLPKEKHTILPFGIVFLFDRLLPAYQIREDHYSIARFYMRVPRKATKDVTGELKTMRYFWHDWPVVAATESQRIQIERSLDVLKVLGLILAVFLVAAINAIVSH